MGRILPTLVVLAALSLGGTAPKATAASGFYLNGAVNAAVVGGDTLFVGGSFTTVYVSSATTSCAVFEQTSVVPLADWPVVDGTVNCCVSDGAGGWYIGGQFLQVGRFYRHNLAHVRADFSVDAWNPDINLPATCMARRGSTLYVAGTFTQVARQSRDRLAAFDLSTGALNPWTVAMGPGTVRAIATLDTVVYIGGDFIDFGSGEYTRNSVVAVGAATGAVLPWNPGSATFQSSVFGLTAEGGVVYVAGRFTEMGGQPRVNVAAVDAVTGLATAWNPGADDIVYGVVPHGDVVYAYGSFHNIGGAFRRNLAQLDATSGMATAWDAMVGGTIRTLAVDGATLYAGGDLNYDYRHGAFLGNLAAIDSTSQAVTSWTPQTSFTVYTLAVHGSRVLVGGRFSLVAGQTRFGLAAFDLVTGELLDWHPVAALGPVGALAVDANRLYVGGSWSYIEDGSATLSSRLVAFDRATGYLAGWNPAADGAVYALHLDGTRLYVGGRFSAIGGQPRQRIAELDATTATATAWNPGADQVVQYIVGSGSVIYASGFFNNIGGQRRRWVAALDAVTGAATPWNPGLRGAGALAVGRGVVYVGGTPVDSATGIANSWNPAPDGSVSALLIDGGALYVGGRFESIGGSSHAKLASLDRVSGHALAWGADVPPFDRDLNSSSVLALARHSTGLIVGGDFTGALMFVPFPSFTLSTSISGSGTVLRSPDLSAYPGSERVAVSATPSAGWTFMGWQGDASGLANPITLPVLGDLAVQAAFADTTHPFVALRSPGAGDRFAEGTSATVVGSPGTELEFAL